MVIYEWEYLTKYFPCYHGRDLKIAEASPQTLWSLHSNINQYKVERKENLCSHGSQTLFLRYDIGH